MSYPKKCRDLAKKNGRPLVTIGFDTRHIPTAALTDAKVDRRGWGSVEIATSIPLDQLQEVIDLAHKILASE